MISHCRSRNHFVFRCEAFTLVELLVGFTMLLIVLGGATTLLMAANRALRNSELRNGREALVDADVATIRELGERYTCCPGTCTTDIATINGAASCAVDFPPADTAKEDYYFPVNTQSAIDSFSLTSYDSDGNVSAETGFCKDGTLVDNLVDTISGLPAVPGVNRAVNVDDALTHRIRITYTSVDPPINREVKIVPTVAAWCP